VPFAPAGALAPSPSTPFNLPINPPPSSLFFRNSSPSASISPPPGAALTAAFFRLRLRGTNIVDSFRKSRITGSAEIVAAATAGAEIGFGGTDVDVGAAEIDVWVIGGRGGRPVIPEPDGVDIGGLGGKTPGGGLNGCEGGPAGGGR
jgi:hypothetical protein